MKILKLKMKNFITYRDEELSFDELNGNVFLITGKTGAGKTTIFDAIMFALYGVASGSERESAGLHCNFAPLSEDTAVTLSFEHGGKAYDVRRWLHYEKKNDGSGYGEKPKPNAELTGERITIKGAENVKEKCEEILGLSAKQFKQIAMLAQGEFKKFLQADEKERQEILEMLFDMNAYKRYAQLLEKAQKALKDRHEEITDDAKASLKMLERDEVDEELWPLLNADHPDIVATLERIVDADREALQTLQKECEDLSAKENAQIAGRERAKSNNTILDELEDARKEYRELRDRRDEMDRRATLAAVAERALRNVKPQIDKLDGCRRAFEDTKRKLSESSGQLGERQADEKEAAEALKKAKTRKGETDEKKIEAEKLKGEMDNYEARDRKCEDLKAEKAKEGSRREAFEQKKTLRSALEERIGNDEKRSGELANCAADALKAQGSIDKAEEGLKALEQLKKFAQDIRDAEQELNVKLHEQAAAESDYNEKERKREQLDRAYHKGIAVELAEKLGEELKVQDTACPVCGTMFKAGGRYTFAVRDAALPTKAQMDAAKEERDKAEKLAGNALGAVRVAESELENARKKADEKAREIFGEDADCASVMESGEVGRCEETLRDDKLRAQEELNAALKGKEELEKLTESLGKNKGEIEKLRNEIETDSADLGECDKRIAALKAELAGITLSYPDLKAAKAALGTLNGEIEKAERELERAQKAFDNASAECNRLSGEIGSLNGTLEEQSAELTKAEKILAAKLVENDFESAEAAQAAHDETWLKGERDALTTYREKVKNAERNVSDAEEKAKDLVRADLTALDGELRETGERKNAAEEKHKARIESAKNHSDVCKNMRRAKQAEARMKEAYDRVTKLNDICKSGYSFERYVLGADFREVLEKANVRLSTLSGGRFSFEHTTVGERANARAGLGIEIRDNYADRNEKCSALSGGESFMSSMALALGLADVAQARAGGRSMDTIFIDEGFGSLDADALDNAVAVLNDLSGGQRTVGIISHVSELENQIGRQIRVDFNEKSCSSASIEVR